MLGVLSIPLGSPLTVQSLTADIHAFRSTYDTQETDSNEIYFNSTAREQGIGKFTG